MKAITFDGKKVKLEEDYDSPLDEPILDNHVIVQVKRVGVCGTDISIVKQDYKLKGKQKIVLGHEFSGTVIKIGKGVEKSLLNQNVVAEINVCCEEMNKEPCWYCRRGYRTHCKTRVALGISVDGCLCQFVSLHKNLIQKVPKNVSLDQACFVEPLAAAYNVFRTMKVEENDKNLAIFGIGRMGILILAVAASMNFDKILIISRSEKKLNFAKSIGKNIVAISAAKENVIERIMEETDDIGADICVECVGKPGMINDVQKAVRAKGKIHLKSTHGLPDSINTTDLICREISIFSSRCGDFKEAIKGLEQGKIKVDALISKRYKLENCLTAFKNIKDGFKTIIDVE